MADTTTRDQNIRLASVDLHLILDGPTPRLIDEWQVAPVLWDAVRFEVDHHKGHGHFILTGSVVVRDDEDGKPQIQHSGAGRIGRIVMRPMSLWESGDSNGMVSLAELFADWVFEGLNCEHIEHILMMENFAYSVVRKFRITWILMEFFHIFCGKQYLAAEILTVATAKKFPIAVG